MGIFLSTSVYFALNSVDFCNDYIYAVPHELPVLSESNFFRIWGFYVIAIAAYTAVFSSEKHDRIIVEEHTLGITE